MRFDLSSRRVQKYGVICGGLLVFALGVSYGAANKAKPPEPKSTEMPALMRATGAVEAQNQVLAEDSDDFTERWTAIKTEAYRAALAEKSRPAEPIPAATPSPAPPASPPAQQPASQHPMAQANEDDLKQYKEEHHPRAEERRRDDICKKGRIYFYRERHQYWHCRR
jgi:hypothetical protein